MRKIVVDIEDLNSSVSYFSLAVKELEEVDYRLKQIGNEMMDDTELQIAPEFDALLEEYNNISSNLMKLKDTYENILSAFVKVPEQYLDVEKRSVDKIKNVLFKGKDYESKINVDNYTLQTINEYDTDGNLEELKRCFNNVLLSHSFSNDNTDN